MHNILRDLGRLCSGNDSSAEHVSNLIDFREEGNMFSEKDLSPEHKKGKGF